MGIAGNGRKSREEVRIRIRGEEGRREGREMEYIHGRANIYMCD